MSYVLHTCKNGIDYCIKADLKTKSFQLVPVKKDSDLSRIFCHPYRIGAVNILNWIKENDSKLSKEELEICSREQFRR